MQQHCENWRQVDEFEECVDVIQCLKSPLTPEDRGVAYATVRCALSVAARFRLCSASTAEAFVRDNFLRGKRFYEHLTKERLADLCDQLGQAAAMPRAPGQQQQQQQQQKRRQQAGQPNDGA